jgi:amino acid adenylation domain-containing protein/thioester reductase-like protein
MRTNKTYYPLTKAQESILIIEKFFPGTSFVNVCATVLLKEQIDFGLFNKALNIMLNHNETLRTRITRQNGEVTQYFAEHREEELPLLDFSKGNGYTDYYHWEKQVSRQAFEFYDSKLYYFALVKLTAFESAFYIKCHHITLDAWSIILLANQVLENYCRLKAGIAPEEKMKTTFSQHILKEQQYLSSPRFAKDRDFWQNIIIKCQEPTLFEKGKANSTEAKRKDIPLSSAISTLINNFCQDYKVSPFIVFASALGIYLAKTKGKDHIVIGAPFLNRSGIKEKNTIGMFINNVPMVIEIDLTKSYLAFLNNLAAEWMKLLRHGSYPYVNILKDYREKHGVTGRLYDVTLSFQNAKFDVQNIEFNTEWHFNDEEINPLSISINDRENEGIFHLDYDFSTDALKEQEIEEMNRGIINLLQDALNNPNKNIGNLSILSASEKHLLLEEFNATDYPYPAEKSIVQLFREQVAAHPRDIALVFEDNELTYREVDKKSNQLASFLIAQGVRRQEIVALKVGRSFNMVIGILGILKAGAAYLPLDPHYPQDRIAYMLADSNARFILTDNSNMGKQYAVQVINLEAPEVWEMADSELEIPLSPSDLAYVMYTSGSTGLPKGVMIENKAVNNFVHGMIEAVGLSSGTILSLTTISFDIFFLETILPVLLGLKVVIADEMEVNDPSLLLDLIERYDVQILQATPSRMKIILNDSNDTAVLNKLEVILVGGEAFPEALLRDLKKVTQAEIYNMYGPTETTIWSTTKRLDNTDLINIGRPIANTRIYILDQHGMPLPVGIPGEIYIAGDGVARGYFNKPELTAEKFLVNPYKANSIMYKTGDLGKWLASGELEFIGRNDNQVKIRGYRIELGEIEKCLLKNEQIKEAIVIGQESKSKRTYLCAYLIGTKLSVSQLRHHLAAYLPDYMIPARFVWLESFPYTPNGKIDRKALARLENREEYQESEYQAPRDKIERTLALVWSEVLETGPIGIDDDFFSLGGDSLAILEVLSGVLSDHWLINAQDFYEYPTIRKLAALISKRLENKCEAVKEEPLLYLPDIKNIKKIGYSLHVQRPSSSGNILLTGSTGFLGSHILKRLVTDYPGRIFCLIRGQEPEARLAKLYKYYFKEELADLVSGKITVLNGDIREKGFGLSKEDSEMLAEETAIVIHCAALVKHYGSYADFEKVNVGGTEQIIDFCKEFGKHLYYVSTISVSGNYMLNGQQKNTFSEQDLYIGQDYKNNVYIRSKFEAECRVLQAKSEGLEATILRVGILTGRYADGLFQYNIEGNAFYRKLKSIFEIKYLPESTLEELIELTPVDYCAEAILRILLHGRGKQTVYHLFNHKMISIKDFLKALVPVGIDVRGIDNDDFLAMINELSKTQNGKEIISGLITDLAIQGSLSFSSNIDVDSTLTIGNLKELGFSWPDLSEDYLFKVVAYMQRVGFLKQVKEVR